MIQTSYHIHTTWSDGSATVPQMIDSARRAGLKEIGISDHFALAPGNPRFAWALAPESLDDYVAEVQQAITGSQDILVRLGLEADYFPETVNLLSERLAAYSFDFLIGSVHFVDSFAIDFEARTWKGLSQNSRDQIWRAYWQRLREAAQSRLFDIIGHFDLPKKFNFLPAIDLTREAMEAMDAVADADMAIEINTSGWDRPVGEAYPALFYLKEANRRKIPLVINSDAHAAGEIVRHFDHARLLAAAAGYTEVVRFEGRKRIPEPL